MKKLGLLLMLGLIPALNGCVPLIAAGVGTGAMIADDRRTTGTYIDDTGIEMTANRLISEHITPPYHVDVTSFNRQVLLTGEMPTVEAVAEAQRLVQSIDNVRRVQNELHVGVDASAGDRGHDGLMTARVRAALLNDKGFDQNHVKVVTDHEVVYLMGLVTRQEADIITRTASGVSGVAKVVKLFEYIDPEKTNP